MGRYIEQYLLSEKLERVKKGKNFEKESELSKRHVKPQPTQSSVGYKCQDAQASFFLYFPLFSYFLLCPSVLWALMYSFTFSITLFPVVAMKYDGDHKGTSPFRYSCTWALYVGSRCTSFESCVFNVRTRSAGHTCGGRETSRWIWSLSVSAAISFPWNLWQR